MLVLDGRVVICIDPKFGSGNQLAQPARSLRWGRLVIREIFHSQIFRNSVFASVTAKGGDEQHPAETWSDG
jgi:hypothetical protein